VETTRADGASEAAASARVGRCPRCAAFTYDVDGLSEEAVRRLVLETEGRVLTRLVPRADGRSMSVDCGHGTVRPPATRPRLPLLALVAVLLLVVTGRALWGRWPAAEVGEAREASPPALEAPPLADPRQPPPEVVVVVEAPTAPLEPVVPAPRPDVHLADVSAVWDDGRARALGELVDALETQLEPMRRCALARMKADPHYRGTVTTRLAVDREGAVSRVSIPLQSNRRLDPRLEACVEAALKALRFAPRRPGSVSFRLVFAGML